MSQVPVATTTEMTESLSDSYSLITKELISKCLVSHKGETVEIISWDVRNFVRPGDNYACTVTSIFVKFRDTKSGRDDEVSYVLKINPRRASKGFNDIIEDQLEKEGRFYLEISPGLNKTMHDIGLPDVQVPKTHFVHLEVGKEVLFMEDLRQRDFLMSDRKKGLDKPHCLLVVKELARLHAASFLLKKKSEGDLLTLYPFMVDGIFGVITKTYKPFTGSLEGMVAGAAQVARNVGGYDGVVRYIETKLQPQYMDIVIQKMELKPPFVVYNAGDCWTNNILFRYGDDGSPVEALLLDLQLARICSPAADLNFFFYSSLDGDMRQENLGEFLSTYYSTFQKVLQAASQDMPFSFDEFEKEYHDFKVFGFFVGFFLLPAALGEGHVQYFLLEEDTKAAWERVTKNNAEGIVRLSRENPTAAARLISIFDEMTASGFTIQ
ncbi:uncharacterized protein LOC143039970 [Oratosquilla oratoria]|uniref:uncharacterized protein LOC143039970 n=1 Tax=Oratosquilla oratoria TaxID=337810 RepID=UPI003F766D22